MRQAAAVAVISVVMAGCGGGGNDGPSGDTFQIETAATTLTTKRRQWTATGDVRGSRVTMNLEIVPWETADGFTAAMTLVGPDGAPSRSATEVATAYGPFRVQQIRDLPYYSAYPGIETPLPATAVTGQSGRLLQAEYRMLTDGTRWLPRGNMIVSWTLEPNTRHSSHLCLVMETVDEGWGGMTKYCFTIWPDGSAADGFQAVLVSGSGPARTIYRFR